MDLAERLRMVLRMMEEDMGSDDVRVQDDTAQIDQGGRKRGGTGRGRGGRGGKSRGRGGQGGAHVLRKDHELLKKVESDFVGRYCADG